MSPEEYKESLRKIKHEYEEAIINLNRRFVFENRKFQRGEIICDRLSIIKIEKVLFHFKHEDESSIPNIFYSGEKLTVKGEPRKHKQIETIDEKEAKKFYMKGRYEK